MHRYLLVLWASSERKIETSFETGKERKKQPKSNNYKRNAQIRTKASKQIHAMHHLSLVGCYVFEGVCVYL